MEAERVMRAEAIHQRVGTQIEGEGVHSQAEPIHLHQPLHSQQHQKQQQQQQQHPFDLKPPYQQTRRSLQPF